MGIFDWKHWLVILVVVVLVFGTKRLKTVGSDLGEAIKGFRKSMNTDEAQPQAPTQPAASEVTQQQPHTIDVQAQKVEDPAAKH